MPRDRRGDFGTFVGIYREHKGFTQTRMAAACNVTQPRFSNWETGKEIPDNEEPAKAIARELQLAEDLLVQIWKGDLADRTAKGDVIVQRAYETTSKGGGTPQDLYDPTR